VGASPTSVSRAEKARILVVEDDGPLRAALVFDLEAEGYAVSAFAAAEQVPKGTVEAECLVVDHTLPGQDGLSLIAQLREQGVDAPAILITTDPNERSRAQAAAIQVEIVEKPLIGRRLQNRIAALISR
jgi:two-component system, LuxR family, response regulator FixJ